MILYRTTPEKNIYPLEIVIPAIRHEWPSKIILPPTYQCTLNIAVIDRVKYKKLQ